MTKIANMNVICEGEGEVLLFLHGFLCSKEIFSKQIKFFSKHFKVIAVDFLGYNGQEMKWAYSLDDYVNSIESLIKELGVEKVNIVAHSFGGRVALKLMAKGNLVNKCVLTGSAGLKPRFNLKVFLKIKIYKTLKFLRLNKLMKKCGSTDYQKLNNLQKQSFVKIVNEHLDGLLNKINAKVMIIFGKNDNQTPIYMAKRLHKNVKNSQLFIIDGGHFAFLENANQFNFLVKEFLL